MITHTISASNPFATRYVRPGAMPYLFLPSANQHSIETILQRLKKNNHHGQIIGPHGSGKSTLLAALLPILKSGGTEPLLFSLHDGQRRLTGEMRAVIAAAPPRSIVIVDGYEQLGRLGRYRLKKRCRQRGFGLLVTTHQSVGLPTLHHLRSDLRLLQAVVGHLLADFPGVISSDDVKRCYQAHGENTREVLFALYDLFEQRRTR